MGVGEGAGPRFRRRSPSAVLQACGRCGPPCGAPTASSRSTTLAYPPARLFIPPAGVPRRRHPTPCTCVSLVPPPRCVPRLPPGRPFSHSCSPSPSSTPAPSPPRPNWPPQYLLPRQRTVTLLSGAHIPLSGRNPMLQEALGIRPHILVLNKMDLADPRRQPVSTGARRTGWLAGRGPTGCRR